MVDSRLNGHGTDDTMETEQARHARLNAMQFEALNRDRRDHLTTTEFKEKKQGHVPVRYLEADRLVNRTGTKESQISLGEKKKLTAWNVVWASLEDDGTDTEHLRDINDGLGQTHRANLMADESVKNYTGEEAYLGGHYGGRSSRGGFGGGRGGGNVGRGGGRTPRKASSAPESSSLLPQPVHQRITRTRVVKGSTPTPNDGLFRLAVSNATEVAKTKPTRAVTASSGPTESSQRQSINYGGLLASPNTFMASIRGSKVPISNKSQKENVSISATPSHVDTPSKSQEKVSSKAPATSLVTSPKKAISKGEATAPRRSLAREKTVVGSRSPTPSPSPDLMDLEMGQAPSKQPVMEFTHPLSERPTEVQERNDKASNPVAEHSDVLEASKHIDALEAHGFLSPEMIATLRARISQARNVAAIKPTAQVEPPPTKKATSPAAIKPTAKAEPPPTEKVIPAATIKPTTKAEPPPTEKVTPAATIKPTTKAEPPPTEKVTPSATIKPTTKAEPPPTEKLTPSATIKPAALPKPFKERVVSIPAIEQAVAPKPLKVKAVVFSTTAPEPAASAAVQTAAGQARPNRSIAQKFANARAVIIGEHVHRTRFLTASLIKQFQSLSISDDDAPARTRATLNPFGPAKSTSPKKRVSSGPSLPAHLRGDAPPVDAGAAARAQYTGDVSSGYSQPQNPPAEATPVEAGTADPATHDPYTGSAPNVSSRLQLPPHLGEESIPVDIGRIHFAGRPGYSSVNAGAATHLQQGRRSSGLSLPPHLQGGTAPIDPGAAARAQYAPRDVLSTVPNGQVLTPFSAAQSAPSAAPVTRKSFPLTGFARLAEERKKGEDPLAVARKRGI